MDDSERNLNLSIDAVRKYLLAQMVIPKYATNCKSMFYNGQMANIVDSNTLSIYYSDHICLLKIQRIPFTFGMYEALIKFPCKNTTEYINSIFIELCNQRRN